MRMMSTVSSRNPEYFDEGDFEKMISPRPLPDTPRFIVDEWLEEQHYYFSETSRPMPDYVIEVEKNIDRYKN